jgi:hypothetical protein
VATESSATHRYGRLCVHRLCRNGFVCGHLRVFPQSVPKLVLTYASSSVLNHFSQLSFSLVTSEHDSGLVGNLLWIDTFTSLADEVAKMTPDRFQKRNMGEYVRMTARKSKKL